MEPNTNPQNQFDPNLALKTVSSGVKTIKTMLILVLMAAIIGTFIYYYKKLSSNTDDGAVVPESVVDNTNNKMDNQENNAVAGDSVLTGDEALISESIASFRDIAISKNGDNFITYAMKPFVLTGTDKSSGATELAKNTKESMSDPKIKFWDLLQAMTLGLTKDVVDAQLSNCKFRERNDNFPPAIDRTASCTFLYTVKPELVGSKVTTPLPVDYKINLLKVSGTWYVDVSGFDMVGFITKIQFPTN